MGLMVFTVSKTHLKTGIVLNISDNIGCSRIGYCPTSLQHRNPHLRILLTGIVAFFMASSLFVVNHQGLNINPTVLVHFESHRNYPQMCNFEKILNSNHSHLLFGLAVFRKLLQLFINTSILLLA